METNGEKTVMEKDTVEDCRDECDGQSDNGCLFFTYVHDSRMCYLKTSNAGRKQMTKRMIRITGIKTSGTSNCQL